MDACLDLEDKRESGESRQHIHKVLFHEPNYLFSYTHLAYQTYLIDPRPFPCWKNSISKRFASDRCEPIFRKWSPQFEMLT